MGFLKLVRSKLTRVKNLKKYVPHGQFPRNVIEFVGKTTPDSEQKYCVQKAACNGAPSIDAAFAMHVRRRDCGSGPRRMCRWSQA